jgi:hypothetical protein
MWYYVLIGGISLTRERCYVYGFIREKFLRPFHNEWSLTIRKGDLPLPTRTPAYVSREVGAAELLISPQTWDRWVEDGILPQPAPGFPSSTPRWRWADVDRKLACQADESPVVDPFMAGAGRLKSNGPAAQTKSRAA